MCFGLQGGGQRRVGVTVSRTGKEILGASGSQRKTRRVQEGGLEKGPKGAGVRGGEKTGQISRKCRGRNKGSREREKKKNV